jgi:uncharacterized protein YdeI (YjbR/CyaY-like superfamily)
MQNKLRKDPRVNRYIENASLFAQPIFKRLHKIVHQACPQVHETMKWGSPFFMYNEKIICGMGEFKNHCKFFLWNWKLINKEQTKQGKVAMDRLYHIASVSELPSTAMLKHLIKQSMKLSEPGARPVRRVIRRKRPPVKTPTDLLRSLRSRPKALAVYQDFSPSHKRHYVDWINSAKTKETRDKRVKKAVGCIALGKTKYWT